MNKKSHPRGVPPKQEKTGVPPKLFPTDKSKEILEVSKTQTSVAKEVLSQVDREQTPPVAPPLIQHPQEPSEHFRKTLPTLKQSNTKNTIVNHKLKAERKRSQWPLLFFTLCVLGALVTVPFLIFRPREETFVLRQFTASTVQLGMIEETVSGSGTVMAKDEMDVFSRVAATVKSLEIKESDDITSGKILVTLASNDLEKTARDAQKAIVQAQDNVLQSRLQAAQINHEAKSKLDNARAGMADLERTLQQSEQMYALGAEAKNNLDAARSKFRTAQREVAGLERAVVDAQSSGSLKISAAEHAFKNSNDDALYAQAKLENLVVKAPFGGRIVALGVRVGQDVTVSTKLLTIADVSKLIVAANLDSSAATRVQAGQPVRVTIGNLVVSGKVIRVASQAVNGNNGATVKIEVELFLLGKHDAENKELSASIRPNSGASVEITIGRKTRVLTLPRGPFLATGGERIVYVLSRDGTKATRTEMALGASNASLVEIRSGLELGARVITSSVEAFKNHSKIEVANGGEIK